MIYSKILIPIFTLSFLMLSLTASALDETTLYQSVLQVRSYKYDTTSGLYTLESLGSSVALPGGKIITNAHVIFDDANQSPYGTYEVCRSLRFEIDPVCYTLARLDAYDLENDLALLTLDKKTTLPIPVLTSDKKYRIGSPLIIYGYPGIGGATITRTAGRVAGYDDPFYKIDGIIDHGNSGGGAFSLSGELVGIPSRLIADNASIGYMIPTSMVRTFLDKKTPGYTRYTLPVDPGFRSFLETKYSEISRKYLFRSAVLETKNLKKYGMRYIKNISLGNDTKEALMVFLSEKKQAQVVLMCGNVATSNTTIPYWKEEMSEESEIVASNRARFTTVRDYIAKDQYSYMIFDRNSPCILIPAVPINPSKDVGFLADLEKFFDEGLSLRTGFSSQGFRGKKFSTDFVPPSVLFAEYPTATGDRNTALYFENSLKKGVNALLRQSTFDREKDFLSALFPLSDLEADPKFEKIDVYMQKDLDKTTKLLTGTLLSGEKYYLFASEAEKKEQDKIYSGLRVFIISPPHDGKWTYTRFAWLQDKAWLDQSELDILQRVIESLSLKK